MKILQSFDKSQVQIGLNARHATFCGIVCGVIVSLVLLAIAIVKIISVFRYDILYLNYWRTEEISSLHLSDLQFKLTLYTTADPQPESSTEQSRFKVTPENIKLTGVSIKLYNQESKMGKIVDRKSYDLVACQTSKFKIEEFKQDEHYFCLPQVETQVFGNPHDATSHYKRAYVKVQTNYSDLHQLIKQKRVDNNQKALDLQQKQDIDRFQAVMSYHFADKSINPYDHNNPLSTQSMKQQKFSGLFSQQMCANISTSLYFSSTNLTTDNNILPLSTDSLKQFKQYWRYQPQYNQVAKKANVAGPLQFFIIFNRAPFTSLYQRRYKRIDTALAQILALSSLTAILLKLLLSHYNKWSSRQYLLQQTTQRSSNSLLQEEQNNIQQGLKYESNVRQYARSITKKAKSEIEMERLEERRKRIDEIEKSGDLIQIYKVKQKLMVTEQKLGILQKILLQDPHFNKLYRQQIHKNKSSSNRSELSKKEEKKRRIEQKKEQKREQKQTEMEQDPLEEQLIINKEPTNNLGDNQEQNRYD